MPFGIVDCKLPEGRLLPGSEFLIDDKHSVHGAEGEETVRLKRVTHKGIETILIPQPSDNDFNDPLLWPRWQKEAAFCVIFINAIIFAVLPGPMLAPATFALAPILGVTLTDVAKLSGYQLLLVAALGPLVSVLAQKFGKRPQFLFAAASGTLGTVICIVGSQQSNYNTLLAGRMVQGLGITAWESLSLAAMGEMFYLHERGWRTALIVCSLACMASTVSIISGVMEENEGYRNLFVAELPFDVAGLLATIFLLPETQYIRPLKVISSQGSPRIEKTKDEEAVFENVETVVTTTQSSIPRKPYLKNLAPWSGISYTDKGIPNLLAGIFVHLINPAVFWIMMVSAVLVCTFVATAYITSQIWSVPPYNLTVAQNGYFWVGPFIGGVLAVVAGPLCDWSAQAMARLNKGVFEAEFRIPVNILGGLFCGLGWFLFMWVVDNPTSNGYYLGSFCLGCVCFGISVPSTSAGLYILDSFPRQSTEVFILQMMLKNFLFYAFSNFINTWAATAGAGAVFRVFGIVSLALLALCIPMYVLGKVNRKLMFTLYARNSLLRAVG
ncbi:hypothetical protein N0V82_007517 [Gnomoniopsis sp. IMI 355080]|nr:hypothetical protein N0V82_007517 [Gnomoniopsis sp. IMI 355080]